jgi:trans-2-enoyl-CoA reductase
MITIVGTLVLDDGTISKIKNAGSTISDNVKAAVKAETINLQNYVKFTQLTGKILETRTHNLQNNIDQRTEETPTSIYGYVGTRIKYGIFWELGMSGSVKSHLRTVTKMFGKALSNPVTYEVRAFTRNNVGARSFLLSALQDNAASITNIIREAAKLPL